MNWKKIFNKPSKSQQEILIEERRLFHNLVSKKLRDLTLNGENKINNNNSHCPNCNSTEFVKKINPVVIDNQLTYASFFSCKKYENQWPRQEVKKFYGEIIIDDIKDELFNDIPTAIIFPELVDFHAETRIFQKK